MWRANILSSNYLKTRHNWEMPGKLEYPCYQMTNSPLPLRSMLFAPGNNDRHTQKALTLATDAVIFDLEDAVAMSEKPAARSAVARLLAADRPSRWPLRYVRVNGDTTEWHADDVASIVCANLDGIVLPKAEHPDKVSAVHARISDLEAKAGLNVGAIDLLPIVETGVGLANVRAIAGCCDRVRRLSFGAADFVVDMGMRWTPSEAELMPARAEIALACRIAGLDGPIDSVWARLDDPDGLSGSAERVRDLGYQGKFCIHPGQLATILTTFSPTADEVIFATAVVDAFDQAEAEGRASIVVEEQFIDYPIAARAARVLATAEMIKSREENQ